MPVEQVGQTVCELDTQPLIHLTALAFTVCTVKSLSVDAARWPTVKQQPHDRIPAVAAALHCMACTCLGFPASTEALDLITACTSCRAYLHGVSLVR